MRAIAIAIAAAVILTTPAYAEEGRTDEEWAALAEMAAGFKARSLEGIGPITSPLTDDEWLHLAIFARKLLDSGFEAGKESSGPFINQAYAAGLEACNARQPVVVYPVPQQPDYDYEFSYEPPPPKRDDGFDYEEYHRQEERQRFQDDLLWELRRMNTTGDNPPPVLAPLP